MAGGTDEHIYDGGTYEMQWDCQYCGTKKLLGVTHRFCPNCGAAQEPDARYFPADDEKVAVENHVYVGADKICDACEALNSASAEFCGTCGAPLTDAARAKMLAQQERDEDESFESSGSRDVVQERFDEEMERVGVKPKQGKKSRKGSVPWWLIAIIAAVVLCIGAVVLTTLWTEQASVYVTGHSWERVVEVEEFGPKREGDWCSSMPAGAYDISRSRKVHHTDQIPDGEDCNTVRIDQGDGSFREEQRCTTRYRSQDVYADYCDYTINTWRKTRTARAEGDSLNNPAPAWPQANLNCEGVQRIGCERERSRSESYNIHLRSSENNADYVCEMDQSPWQAVELESRWKLEIGKIDGTPRCDTLEALQ